MLYVDTPTKQDIKALNRRRCDACVSIYVATTPLSQQSAIGQTDLKNLAKQAGQQLEDAGFDKRRLAALMGHFDELHDDDEFWRLQANSLAVLATPDDVLTFRLANKLLPSVEVADRFHLKPLLRAVAFPHAAFVLSISENAARLVEVASGNDGQEVKVPGMPKDAASSVHRSNILRKSPLARIQGEEGQKILLARFARIVDAAVRPILAGRDVPLVLAASEPLASIYRSVCSAPSLLAEGIKAADDRTTPGALAESVNPILVRLYAQQIDDVRQLFEARQGGGRAYQDLSDVARAATFGAVETLLVDMDAMLPGSIDGESGALTLASEPGPSRYDVLDEIAARTLDAGGQVLSVRSKDIPGGGPVAAVLRYAV